MTQQELWSAILEGAKEPLRLLVLAVVPLLITYFGELSIEGAGIIIVLLRLLDSVMHEMGKARISTRTKTRPVESKLVKGLTRF
jgi:hypothetical protein